MLRPGNRFTGEKRQHAGRRCPEDLRAGKSDEGFAAEYPDVYEMLGIGRPEPERDSARTAAQYETSGIPCGIPLVDCREERGESILLLLVGEIARLYIVDVAAHGIGHDGVQVGILP